MCGRRNWRSNPSAVSRRCAFGSFRLIAGTLQADPEASFGKYDYLVGQNLVAQFRASRPGQTIRFADDANLPKLRLAQKRLEIFRAGPL